MYVCITCTYVCVCVYLVSVSTAFSVLLISFSEAAYCGKRGKGRVSRCFFSPLAIAKPVVLPGYSRADSIGREAGRQRTMPHMLVRPRAL